MNQKLPTPPTIGKREGTSEEQEAWHVAEAVRLVDKVGSTPDDLTEALNHFAAAADLREARRPQRKAAP